QVRFRPVANSARQTGRSNDRERPSKFERRNRKRSAACATCVNCGRVFIRFFCGDPLLEFTFRLTRPAYGLCLHEDYDGLFASIQFQLSSSQRPPSSNIPAPEWPLTK